MTGVNLMIGTRVTINIGDGRKFDGWFYGEVPQGLLLSEDIEGRRVVLVPNVLPRSYSYPEDKERAKFAPADQTSISNAIRDLDNSLGPKIKRALRQLDYRPMQRFADRAQELKKNIWISRRDYEALADLESSPDQQLLEFIAARTDETIHLHTDVFDELERSGLANAISEHAQELGKLPSKYIIPSIDIPSIDEALGEKLEAEAAESIGNWSVEKHRASLDDLHQSSNDMVFQMFSRRGSSGPQRVPGRRLSIFGGVLQIIAGTALAGANSGLGLTAGLAASILTVGATTVPTYVAVAGSIAGGLTTAGSGCAAIGAAIKPTPSK